MFAIFFSNEIIWEVYYENIERNMFIIGFISCSLLVIIFIQNPCEETNDQYIKKIKIISQLAGKFRNAINEKNINLYLI